MGLRDSMNNNSAVVTIGAVALLVVALLVLVMQFGGGSGTNKLAASVKGFWFYDTGTNQFYIASLDDIAPVIAPSGKPGIQAMLFTCDECGNRDLSGKTPADLEAEGMVLGYFTQLSKEGRKHMDMLQKGAPEGQRVMMDPQLMQMYRQVRVPNNDKWMPEMTASHITIEIMQNMCTGSFPKTCLPGMK